MIELAKKICTTCHKEKPLLAFNLRKHGRFGVDSKCKMCKQLYRKKYRETHKKERKEYLAKNRIKIRTQMKKNAEKHKEEKRAYDKIYRETNKSKISADKRTYQKKKRKIDPGYRLSCSVSAGVSLSLKDNKSRRSWESIVGYTLDQLIKHLEKQFTDGMTWENYGQWHLEHKIPLSVHHFTKPEHTDFQKVWGLKNLQPMWAKDNFKKGVKLEKHFQPSLLL